MAERIAEQGTRDLFVKRQRLKLVESIASAANLLDDPSDAFRVALDEICTYTGWATGHVWILADYPSDTVKLVSSGVWSSDSSVEAKAFRRVTESMSFGPGPSLPGRVLQKRQAVWISDIALDVHFQRTQVARECGLRAAFAFPALIGTEVGAVLEFFQGWPREPDETLMRTVEQIGAQLGRVVERKRNSDRAAIDKAALEAEHRAAEQASRAKSAFLAVTSHEVRTPLNAVLGLAQTLRREPLTPGQHELVDGVLASGEMLLRLLNAVLDMSKIEANEVTAHLSDFDPGTMVGAIVRIWTPYAREQGIELSLDTTELGSRLIRSDEGRIEQTVVNLVANAIKFTPRGESIAIRVSSVEGSLRVEVIDGGPGVDDSDRERIFQPFEQTETGREAGGTGLGLSICTGNVRLLGGEIGTDRTETGRSRFWFQCPVETSTRVHLEQPVEPDEVQGGLRVLAAEDNPANRRVLQLLLAPANVELTFAEDGQQALNALATARFDLVLMDANMPVMDGVEAVRRIRSGDLAPGATIQMLTANAFTDDVSRYMAAGADGVLTKPIHLPSLFAVLAACGKAVPSSSAVALSH
nr:ATP-binding protein [Brevundimonas variabilis]